ncbi:MAG: hypothetical protein ACLQVY_27250 [Limisphaerales bacterium]
MNAEERSDKPLNTVLRQWTVEAPLPPRFREQVWQRIARSEEAASPASRPSLTAWLESVFSRPTLAVCYIAVLLLAGATTGLWQAKYRSSQAELLWRALYVQSIDPYRMSGN